MYRKLYHISGLVFPLIMALWSRQAALLVSGSFLLLIVIFDAARLASEAFNRLVFRLIPFMFKPREVSTLSGSPYFMAGVFLSLLLFDPHAAAGGIIYLSLGDMTAALAGERYGKTVMFGKTLEGAAAFAAATFLAVSALSLAGVLELSLAGIAAGALICAAVELIPLGIDDNLLIPLAGSVTLALLG